MHKRNQSYKKHILNFRQWSRKGYAVFSSLGKVVRIAVLNRATSDRLLDKSSYTESFNRLITGCINNESISELIDELEVLSNVNINHTAFELVAIPTNNDNNHINNTQPIFSCPVSIY